MAARKVKTIGNRSFLSISIYIYSIVKKINARMKYGNEFIIYFLKLI